MEKETAEEELKRYKEEHGERFGLIHLLDNFLFNLPSDDFEEGGYYRKKSFYNGHYDISNKEHLLARTPKHLIEEVLKPHSDLKLNQTPRQFFETIDKVLQELDIPVDEIKRLQHLGYAEGKNIEYMLYQLTFPAYVKLREIGYTKQDLVG